MPYRPIRAKYINHQGACQREAPPKKKQIGSPKAYHKCPKIVQHHQVYLTELVLEASGNAPCLGNWALTLGSTIQHGPVYSPWHGEHMGGKDDKTGAGFGNANVAQKNNFKMCVARSFIPNRSRLPSQRGQRTYHNPRAPIGDPKKYNDWNVLKWEIWC